MLPSRDSIVSSGATPRNIAGRPIAGTTGVFGKATALKTAAPALLGLALACTTSACHDGSSDAPPPAARSQPVSLEEWHGRLAGTATIAGDRYEVEGILTIDRVLRLLVESATDPGAQLIGHVDVQNDHAVGSGVVIGQACGTPSPSRFCGDTPSLAEVSFAPAGSLLDDGAAGQVQVTTGQGKETWSLALDFAGPNPATAAGVASFEPFMEGTLSGLETDVIELSIEIDGDFSLTGGHSGCTGTGSLTPPLGGGFDIYAATLAIEGCDPTHASLNTTFEGLATYMPFSPGGGGADYFAGAESARLQVWLSTPDGALSPVAATIVAFPQEWLTQAWQGYYSGSVTIDDQDHYAEALLTVDGEIRIYVAGLTLQPSNAAGSMQFIGNVLSQAGSISGSGIVIGQGCATYPGRLCGQAAAATVSITAGSPNLAGTIRVATSAGTETWSLLMSWPTQTYLEPATLGFAEGLYQESAAEFAAESDVVESVDAQGRLFLQSAATGCVANGELAPHLDGAVNVYDVSFVMASCNATYAYLNGSFTGLATRTVGDAADYWDYWGDWLVIWLSRLDESASEPVAVTLWGDRL